jgi:hypothetical protein
MSLITLYRTDDGVERLLAQPGDVVPRVGRATGLSEASPEHRSLFESYRQDLATAYGIAKLWWEDTVAAQERLGKGRDEAIEVSFDRRLAGAASHPKVVWIVRTYWLACADLPAVGSAVWPERFLLQWLIDAGESELVRLIACMPYWPVGLDENGNWC